MPRFTIMKRLITKKTEEIIIINLMLRDKISKKKQI